MSIHEGVVLWHADYPEGENFTQLLYGLIGRGNQSCYQSDAYDNLYRQAMQQPPENHYFTKK